MVAARYLKRHPRECSELTDTDWAELIWLARMEKKALEDIAD